MRSEKGITPAIPGISEDWKLNSQCQCTKSSTHIMWKRSWRNNMPNDCTLGHCSQIHFSLMCFINRSRIKTQFFWERFAEYLLQLFFLCEVNRLGNTLKELLTMPNFSHRYFSKCLAFDSSSYMTGICILHEWRSQYNCSHQCTHLRYCKRAHENH